MNVFKVKAKVFIASWCLCCFGGLTQAQGEVELLTNTWPPYINAVDEPLGSAAEIMELILRRSKVSARWTYVPYELALFEVSQGAQLISYPYFKTKKRQEQVLYSAPIFTVSSKIFYNRQYLNQKQAKEQFDKKLRIGKVAGYSYGESLDEAISTATVFNNEKRALTALFNHEIDLLPMTESVLDTILNADFPQRQQLIRPLENVEEVSSLHLIAAKSAAGKAIIERVDQALLELKTAGLASIQNEPFEAPVSVDVASLVVAEGYPTILGQTAQSGAGIEYYTLPLGTGALVLEWSKNMLKPAANDRLYQHMMDLSKVVILNGPHVGKELYVRNMHIELR